MQRYFITQTQLNRIRDICQAGTQAHGDEFYEQVMATIDGVTPAPAPCMLSDEDKRQIADEAQHRDPSGNYPGPAHYIDADVD